MLILGIESSCDETGAAIVKDGRYLLSNVVASQAEIHNRYGGVVPEVASRQQLTTIIPVIEMTLDKAACGWENIDDDAAGEAFDKVARILGLSYPGGPSVQQAAQSAEEELQRQGKSLTLARNAYRLPRAWLRGTYDFSFSGLKTAVLHLAEGASEDKHQHDASSSRSTGGKQISQYTRMGEQAAQRGGANVGLLAASFQEAVVDVLAVKTRLAAQEYHVKQVLLAGGVAANISLRTRLEQELRPLNIRLSYPPIEFCTDNAAMIASTAFFHLLRGEQHGFDLDVEPGLSLPFIEKVRM